MVRDQADAVLDLDLVEERPVGGRERHLVERDQIALVALAFGTEPFEQSRVVLPAATLRMLRLPNGYFSPSGRSGPSRTKGSISRASANRESVRSVGLFWPRKTAERYERDIPAKSARRLTLNPFLCATSRIRSHTIDWSCPSSTEPS